MNVLSGSSSVYIEKCFIVLVYLQLTFFIANLIFLDPMHVLFWKITKYKTVRIKFSN